MSQNEETPNVLKPSKDLGILVGLLLTDGNLSKHGTSYQIEFTNKSQELHKLFKQTIRNLFNINKFSEFFDSRFKDIKRTILRNKKICENLIENFGTFRTKQFDNGLFPESRIPDFIFKLPENELREILRVMFSADGAVSIWVVRNKRKSVWEIKKLIKISCKHPLIRNQLFQLLKKLKFSPTLRTSNDEVVLFKKEDIKKFQKEIGFVQGVKITRDSRHWEGFEKNSILNLAIKTFGIKNKQLNKFNKKEEIISFLKII